MQAADRRTESEFVTFVNSQFTQTEQFDSLHSFIGNVILQGQVEYTNQPTGMLRGLRSVMRRPASQRTIPLREDHTHGPMQSSSSPLVKIKYSDSKAFNTDCPICLENFTQDDAVIRWPCAHVLCDKCANTVLNRGINHCTLCREGAINPPKNKQL